MFDFITNLSNEQRAGFDFQSQVKDESLTETQNGIQRKVIRKISNTYKLTLQGLSINDVKEFVRLLTEAEQQDKRLNIPVNLFSGYLGKATSILDVNFNSDDFRAVEDEYNWDVTLKVVEVIIP